MNTITFPHKISDLDNFTKKVLQYGKELDSDHPGFTDNEYRLRRKQIIQQSQHFKHGDKIPTISYTEQEISTWRTVYTDLKEKWQSHACKLHNEMIQLLEQKGVYSTDSIPKLEDVSEFLKGHSGWQLRPVNGFLSARDFLNGMAFKVFHATQYIRHHSQPLYTPEPDVCHELLGHIPLLLDPDFADFAHRIGLSSLGASDQDIDNMFNCFWYTGEFGLSKEDGQLKAFGGGLLSSSGELIYSVGLDDQKPIYKTFDISELTKSNYTLTQYQPLYFVTETIQQAIDKVLEYLKSTDDRPFEVIYKPQTQSIDLLNKKLLEVE